MTFGFTLTQLEDFKDWKNTLQNQPQRFVESPKWNDLVKRIREESSRYNEFLHDSGFDKGTDLSTEQLDKLFRDITILPGDKSLGKHLYNHNGKEEFNSRLRNLLFEDAPIVKRIDQFVRLEGVREQTMSHFLCLRSLRDFPYFSDSRYFSPFILLGIHSTQEEDALKQALEEHSISNQNEFCLATLSYLKHWVIFREVKEQLGFEDYAELNIFF